MLNKNKHKYIISDLNTNTTGNVSVGDSYVDHYVKQHTCTSNRNSNFFWQQIDSANASNWELDSTV